MKQYRANDIFQATECNISFQNSDRQVLLLFVGERGRFWVRFPEHMMAGIAGHFMRERLFGLH